MKYIRPAVEVIEYTAAYNMADLTSQTDNGFIDTDPGNFGPVIK